MAETDDDGHEPILDDLDKGDLRPLIYEGGFKTWECAIDLAKIVAVEELDWLLGREDGGAVHVIEVSATSRRMMEQFESDSHSWARGQQSPASRSINHCCIDQKWLLPGVLNSPYVTTMILYYVWFLCPTFSLQRRRVSTLLR